MEWDALEPTSAFDGLMRLIVSMVLIAWTVFEGLSLRTPYPAILIEMWHSPIWRMLFLLAIWLGAEWCPRIGLLTAVAVLFYIVDMMMLSNE